MTIDRIEWGLLEGRRPRVAGSNARLGAHGDRVRVPLLRLTTADGAQGIGPSWAGQAQAEALLGQPVDSLWSASAGTEEAWRGFDYPLWDLAGVRAGLPVYALAAQLAGRPVPAECRVRCYDTSLYFDDLDVDADDAAASLMASEAQSGYDAGHRAFKLKVGRGARWMAPEAGLRRDLAVIQAVRAAIGPEAPLLLDANNGWNLNLTKHVLRETAESGGIYWMEEPFHEDAELYGALKDWLHVEGLKTLIADGEGEASPSLMRWAEEGLVDVVQYDIFGHGFTRWLHTGQRLESWGAMSAPHHYGGHVGNYLTGHLAPALEGFTFVEWDHVDAPGLSAPGYAVADGLVTLPATPGFGLTVDEQAYTQAVAEGGWSLKKSSFHAG